MQDACKRYHVAVHAYVLMTNHVHLLLTPEEPTGISCVMQSVGRRYVQYINYEYRRSGTLWEGRHKASMVEAETYLLTCMRYIELNPVRAGIVNHPAEYRWSSYQTNAQGKESKIITPHECYLAIDTNKEALQNAYRCLFENQIDNDDIHTIREASQFSMPLGSERFNQQIEAALARSIGYSKRGRPMIKEDDALYCDYDVMEY